MLVGFFDIGFLIGGGGLVLDLVFCYCFVVFWIFLLLIEVLMLVMLDSLCKLVRVVVGDMFKLCIVVVRVVVVLVVIVE